MNLEKLSVGLISVYTSLSLAVTTIILGIYPAAGIFVLASVFSFRFLISERSFSFERDVRETLLSFTHSVREIVILSVIASLPMIPKSLAALLLASYGLQQIFRLETEKRLNRDIYRGIDPEWILGMVSVTLIIAWFNSFIIYWGTILLTLIYLAEIASVIDQVR